MKHRPVVVQDHEITLRPLRFRDRAAWQRVRSANTDWLAPWEATRPQIDSDAPLPTFYQMVRFYKQEGRELRSISLGIWLSETGRELLIGQITLGGLVFGAYRGGHIGYWIDRRYANRGYATRAVKALTAFAFTDLQLHRIEINLRPENSASKRVAEKSGYYFEGMRAQYLHIAGGWRDHLTYVAENSNNLN